ncbi:MAG: hypothetical protein CMM49_06465 [Rhodospirillaceae bacterium]|nr:hypothetical protein [Rhodospirillaceae bacterium]
MKLKKYIDYQKIVDKSLRKVIKHVLKHVYENGMEGDHHLYITFLTQYEGVEIPEYLINEYPNEITIILQHQFWNLEINENSFSISLSFNNNTENIKVPYNSITSFADPSVNFGLQFKDSAHTEGTLVEDNKDQNQEKSNLRSDDTAADNVIAFTDFHKKPNE